MPPRLRQPARSKSTTALRKFAKTEQVQTRLLGDIQRLLMDPARVEADERDLRVLHVSELVKSDWCMRRAYYRITGVPVTVAHDPVFFQMENIWEEGHVIETKWRDWINQLGRLRGRWKCLHCSTQWNATSPKICVECGSTALQYREVPIWNEEYQIEGNADGDIDEGHEDISEDPLLEVKSIGLGTLRFEAPGLLKKYTHKVLIDDEEKSWVDLDKLWREIRRPFPSHLKQALIYAALMNRKWVIFIYEFKPTQAVKEFVVKLRPGIVEDLLDEAQDLKYQVEKGRVPGRPAWANVEDGPCTKCAYRDTCWSTNEDHDESQARRVPAPTRSDRGTASAGEGRPRTGVQAKVRSTASANEPVGPDRRRADGPVREVHTVGRLRQRPTGSGDDRGESRRGAARFRRSDSPGR